MRRLRLAIFGSGGGTNMQAIVDAVEDGSLDLDIVLVVSNKSTAGVLERAERYRIETAVLDPREYDEEESYARDLLDILDRAEVNFIALAGYLRKIPSSVVARFKHRIVNIHPALLPAFGGKGYYGHRVHVAAIEHGVKWTGATVHIVDDEYDTGPIVIQEPVRVEEDDTAETLDARVLKVEHKIFPEALRLFVEGRVTVEGRRARIG